MEVFFLFSVLSNYVFTDLKTSHVLQRAHMVIRQMLVDERLKIDNLNSFNQSDFQDICTRRNIRILSK